jgi:copper homeostasis protein
MSSPLLEVCVDSYVSAMNAIKAGAARLEVCSALSEGGLTPSSGLVRSIIKSLEQENAREKVQVFVMIRSRSGDFAYESYDVYQMKLEIESLLALADGFVFGCLHPDGRLQEDHMITLMQECAGKPITFHRAFDVALDPFEMIDQLTRLGVARILTSGQATTAELGLQQIKRYIEHASNRIIVLPGCGINSSNIRKIAAELKVQEYHSSASSLQTSKMAHKNRLLYPSQHIHNTYDFKSCDHNEALRIVVALKSV